MRVQGDAEERQGAQHLPASSGMRGSTFQATNVARAGAEKGIDPRQRLSPR